jgi:hypothetical protein
MFRQRQATHRRLRTRVGAFAFGLLMVCYGTSLLNRGIFVFRNQYRMEVYSPAVTVTGGVFMLLALIPDRLVKGWIKSGEKTKPRSGERI